MRRDLQILDFFLKHAAESPDRIALYLGHEVITYGQLEKLVRKKANALSLQLQPDDSVLILKPLSIDVVVTILALLGRGNPVVFVEEWTRTKDVAEAIAKTSCRFVLCSWKLNLIRIFVPGLRGLKRLAGSDKAADDHHFARMSPDGAALISFSSGTSGQSKAVVRTRANLLAQFNALSQLIKVDEQAVMGTNFAVVILLNLGLGIGTFISRYIRLSDLTKTDYGEWLNELKASPVTHLAHSPQLLRFLAKELEKRGEELSFKQVISGGSAQFPAHFRYLSRYIQSENWTLTYGSSEAEPIAHCNLTELLDHGELEGLYIGHPVEEADCFLMPQAHSEDGAGEILVAGDHVVSQYLSSDEAYRKSKVIINDQIYHRCGDRSVWLRDGALMLTGPLSANQNVYALEKKLSEMDFVKHGTILGHVAYVEPFSGFDRYEMESNLRVFFPQVREIRFIKMPLDRRHRGKILYARLGQAKTI